jgi:hypothetical protein
VAETLFAHTPSWQQDARTLFMAKILARARRSLLVYTIYCHAHEHATEWTGIEVHSVLATPVRPDPDPRPPGDAGPKPRCRPVTARPMIMQLSRPDAHPSRVSCPGLLAVSVAA